MNIDIGKVYALSQNVRCCWRRCGAAAHKLHRVLEHPLLALRRAHHRHEAGESKTCPQGVRLTRYLDASHGSLPLAEVQSCTSSIVTEPSHWLWLFRCYQRPYG